jgi:hypothetical protein
VAKKDQKLLLEYLALKKGDEITTLYTTSKGGEVHICPLTH